MCSCLERKTGAKNVGSSTKHTLKLFCKSGQLYEIDPYLVQVLFDPYPVQWGQTGWQITLRQAGREGYAGMISDDIHLAQELYRVVGMQSELQVFTQNLSITTFRYVPPDLMPGSHEVEQYLNALNAELLTRLQKSGEAFLSNAVIGTIFVLRACIVNFRTSLEDIEALPGIVIRLGREVDAAIRPAERKYEE